MKKTVKSFLSAVLSMVLVFSCFSVCMVFAAEEATAIPFSRCDSVVSSNPNPTVDTENFTEGTGSLIQQWDSRNNFSLYLTTDGVDASALTDITGKFFVLCDIFVKDDAEITNLTKLNRLLLQLGSVAGINGWKNSVSIDIKSGEYTSTGAWKVGWNHLAVPVDTATGIVANSDIWDMSKIGFVRFMADGFNRAGYFQVDDVRFSNGLYIDSAVSFSNDTKDMEVAIRSLPEPDEVTAGDGEIIAAVTKQYYDFKCIRVTRASIPVSNHDKLYAVQNAYDYKFCEQAGDFDMAFGTEFYGRPEANYSVLNYTAENRTVEQSWMDTTKLHSVAFYDRKGLDISGAIDAENRFFLTVDIYVYDVEEFLNRGRLNVYMGTTDGIDDVVYSQDSSYCFACTMLQHWCSESYLHNDEWKQGWNTVGIVVDLDDPYQCRKEYFDATKFGYVLVWSDSNRNEGPGSFETGDIHIMSNKTYYEKFADFSAAKLITNSIAQIGKSFSADRAQVIADARTAYDSASESVKAMVSNYSYLTDAEATLDGWKNSAAAVDEKINAIGTVTADSETKIVDARKAYDALDKNAASFVLKYDVLQKAESDLEIAQSDIKAAAVDELIDKIGEVTLQSGEAITAARTAFDALSETAKAKVQKRAELEAAEAKYAEITAYTPGNVDEKDDVTAADALLALQHSVGKITLTGNALKAADVDNIEGVTAADALMILQRAVGKISEFPCEKIS